MSHPPLHPPVICLQSLCRLQTARRQIADNNYVKTKTYAKSLSAACRQNQSLCKLAKNPVFLRVTAILFVCTRIPTLTGVEGSHQRLRLVPPSLPTSSCSHVPGPSTHHHVITRKKEIAMSKPVVVRKINFANQPDIGTVLMKEGQRYEVIALEPHIRTDGTMTTLIVWQSHCAETGHPFEFRTGLKTKYINRRCKQHSKPGNAVAKAGRLRKHDFLRRHGWPSQSAKT